MEYNIIILIAVILLFFIYQKFKNTESLNNINSPESIKFLDETILRIRCQFKSFDWEEPYLEKSSKESIGSGFFIDDQGHILTNYHVVEEAIKVFVQIPKYGNKTFDCEVLSIYPFRDIALLKIKDHKNKNYLKLGDSDKIVKGNLSYAIGYPLGQNKFKVTSGVVSGFQDGDIQMDSPINPGNSGGPLVNDKLEIIGINYSGFSEAQNVGYAIPINYVKVIMDDMWKRKIIFNPVMGCSFNNTNKSMLKYTQLCDSAYYISYVGKNSPMDKAGIKSGDLICSVDGINIDNYGELLLPQNNSHFHIFDYLNYKKIGDKLSLKIIKLDGDKITKENKEIKLASSEYYKVRDMYPAYEKIDYQIIGGMVIMELTRNHIEVMKEKTNIKKFKRVDELVESKLIITKIIKGSALGEDNIFIAPCILEEVNGIEVKKLKQLRDALPKFKENNGHKFISFLTENHKFIILDIGKIKEEELFLSNRFNYEVTNYTKKLLGFYDKIKPAPAKVESQPPQ
jgi:serine protease Do